MPLLCRLVETVCPTCQARTRVAVRRHTMEIPAGSTAVQRFPCTACTIDRERAASKGFMIAQLRLVWRQAGAALDDYPDVLLTAEEMAMRKAKTDAQHKRMGPGAALRQQRNPPPPKPRSVPTVISDRRQLRSRPRVVFITHDFSLTGAPRILWYLLPKLRGMDVAVHSLRPGPMEPLFESAGIEVVDSFGVAAADLVVINTLAATVGIELAMSYERPWIWLVHEWNPGPPWDTARLKELWPYAQDVVFAHPAQAVNFADMPPVPNRVIRSRIPATPRRKRHLARRDRNYPDDAFVALTFGTNEPRKGQQDLVKAVAGTSIRTEYVNGCADPFPWYAAADVYVCTSRAECYSLSIQEAKDHGLPVVSTDIPCAREMIEDNVSGLLYKPGDVETLREHLLALQGDVALCKRLAADRGRMPPWETTLLEYERLFLAHANGEVDRPLTVVYHIAGMGADWKAIVGEQLGQLARAGLRQVFCTHVGEGKEWCIEQARSEGIALQVVSHHDRLDVYETPAMFLIEDLCRASDEPILYLHTKGVSHPRSATVYHEWRRLQMDLLVSNWRWNLSALGSSDAVGVNWWTKDGEQHFSGNFWMARAEWLRKLPDFKGYYKDRYSCERWIGAAAGCRAFSLGCQDAKFWAEDRGLLAELRGVESLSG